MKEKICLITGATSGIGKAAAHTLAGMGGYHLILVGRDSQRTQETLSAIQMSYPQVTVDYCLADLSSQEAIRSLAQEVQEKYDHLDILINNAGAVFTTRHETVDGIEMTFALNHLAYFLLTHLLLDLLKESAPARIVNVASHAHYTGMGLNPEDLENKKRYSGFRVYGESKLLNILFTYELAKRLEGTKVTVNCLHPGVIASRFGLNNRGLFGWLTQLAAPFLSSPESGAETTVYLASSPDLEQVNGKYFAKKRSLSSARRSYDQALQKHVWEISEKMVGLKT